MADGYFIQEQRDGAWVRFAFYGVDEPGAVSNARWYNFLTRGRRVFRVVLKAQDHLAVVYG